MINILWDLDGTLVDSIPAVAGSFNHTLAHYGKPTRSFEELRPYIGPGLDNIIAELLDISDKDEIAAAKMVYREHYQQSLTSSEPFEGVLAALEAFKQIGAQQFVATAKYELYAEQIIEANKLNAYFSGIYGSTFDGKYADKKELLTRLFEQENLRKADTVMIGDTKYDMEAGRYIDIATTGVLWGYSDEVSLKEAGAHDVVETPDKLFDVVKKALNTFC
ncbi:HAD family hydrolase [Reinekea marina]|uniref:HAD family hydrolase n=1 Tax=Reinekea marina TaxID=1310421 RepID=A0ABV7WRF4_9GAMM